jgi:hypothetical protein
MTLLQSLQAGQAVGVERLVAVQLVPEPAQERLAAAVVVLDGFEQLVAWQLAAVLHFIPDSDDPYGIVDIVKSVMAPGSYLVISHATQDSMSREETLGGMSIYDKASAPMIPRRYGDVSPPTCGCPAMPATCRWSPALSTGPCSASPEPRSD